MTRLLKTGKAHKQVCTGKAYTADLSVDDSQMRVRVIVRLRTAHEPTPSQLRSLIKLQDSMRGLCFVSFDADHGLVHLRSCSVLPTAAAARLVIPQIIADLLQILEDDNLNHILN